MFCRRLQLELISVIITNQEDSRNTFLERSREEIHYSKFITLSSTELDSKLQDFCIFSLLKPLTLLYFCSTHTLHQNFFSFCHFAQFMRKLCPTIDTLLLQTCEKKQTKFKGAGIYDKSCQTRYLNPQQKLFNSIFLLPKIFNLK